MKKGYLLVNFGGPRDLEEVTSFLQELLGDKDVVRTRFPQPIHSWLFKKIARRRAEKIIPDYAAIGGRSPIYADTEAIAEGLRLQVEGPVEVFHRYLPATHEAALARIEAMGCSEITVFPFFPQFTYATTGSIARFLAKHLKKSTRDKLRWIPAYFQHPLYIQLFQKRIASFLTEKGIREEEVVLLFSAHGVPKKFVSDGDPYEAHCQASYRAILAAFPQAEGILAYQSKFGPGEWLKPYTEEVCQRIIPALRTKVVCIPLSFTSDHIETLFEIEQQYLPPLRDKGWEVHRLPAFNRDPTWVGVIIALLEEGGWLPTEALVRPLFCFGKLSSKKKQEKILSWGESSRCSL